MTPEDEERLETLCYMSKRGLPIGREDSEFIQRMYDELGAEAYGEIQKRGADRAVAEVLAKQAFENVP